MIATLQSDIEEFNSAKCARNAIYAEIGADDTKARQMREARWAATTRLREAAENVIMSMLGHHRPALSRAGLVEFYESMAAGKETFDTLVKIATATAKHYGKPA